MLLSVKMSVPTIIGGRVWYTCPFCGNMAVYFSMPPDFCDECKSVFPNLKNLVSSQKAREQFHLGHYLETWAEEYYVQNKRTK